MSVPGAVHVIVPDSIDDPARPSGGNVYDRRICDELAAIGWRVHEYAAPGDWPKPDAVSRRALTAELTRLADGALVLIDGLIASAAADLPEFARRLRLVVLVHMPLAQKSDDGAGIRTTEAAALSAATAVVATSTWTQQWLTEHYALEPGRIHTVEPGTDAAEPTPRTAEGRELLCVAAVTPAKGHDVLVAALTEVSTLSWACVCVGRVDIDTRFVARLQAEAEAGGIADRIRFVGVRTGAELDATYAAADLVVVGSRAETYGMVVTEALARGIPVVATAVGGVPEALGHGADQVRPGILVPPDDPHALAAALRRWLSDRQLRLRLRQAAMQRRDTLPSWAVTAGRLSEVLTTAAA
ncbi:glycosyltransferase family 4 protein [Parafrigoribacterium mesophilum]|uniref:glycosyltransferase family 4 protein n=1 Tax=Parafrigoribacterium mesophilum TaxID=433646 RepID=UPI0031FD32AB